MKLTLTLFTFTISFLTVSAQRVPPNMIIAHLTPKDSSSADREFWHLCKMNFISGSVFFAGAGFPRTIGAQGGMETILFSLKTKLQSGTIVSFEKCVFFADDGKTKVNVSKTFLLQ